MQYLTISDPHNDGHVVYLHPRQGFCLELSLPDSSSDWSVECFSEYFVLANSEIKQGVKRFYYQQLYDLKTWARVSSVQLAEVLMQFKGKVPENSGDKYKTKTILIVLQGKNEEQRDTLTIINPVATKTRIAPHQLLEIVLFDQNAMEIHHECLIDTIIRAGQPHFDLEEIASKTVVHKFTNGHFEDVNNDPHLINRHIFNLPVNPKIEDGSPLYPRRRTPENHLYQAKHFFFQMKRKCVDDVQPLPNGVYEVCEIAFFEPHNMTAAEYGVEVSFAIKGSNKPKLRHMSLTRRQRLMVDESVVHGIDVGKKCLARERFFEKNRLLINPSDRDNIDFVEGEENCLVVEIAPPKVWDQEFDENVKWDVTADPVWQFQFRHLPEMRMTVTALDDRVTLGVQIQRFMVSPIQKTVKTSNRLTFLGILKLVCRQGTRELKRYISVYLTKPIECSSRSKSYTQPRKPLPVAPTPFLPPQIIKIKIEELKDNSLKVFGGMSTCFKEIKMENDNSTNTGKKKKK